MGGGVGRQWSPGKSSDLKPLEGFWGGGTGHPPPPVAPDLRDRPQSLTIQREASKVAAQFEGQCLNGGRLQGEVVALEAGIQQRPLQTVDETEGKRNAGARSGGGARRAAAIPGRKPPPPRLTPATPTSGPLPTRRLRQHLSPYPIHPLLINSCSGPSLLTPPPGSLPWLLPAD